VLGLTPAGGLEPAMADALTDAIAAEVSRAGLFDVTSQKDMQTVLGLERQRQLLGCSDEAASCLTELAGALGARFVLSGSVARLGPDAVQLNLQTIDSVKAQASGRATRIAKDVTALRRSLPYALAEATGTPPPPAPSHVLPYTLIGVGAAAAIGAGVTFFQAFAQEQAALKELEIAKEQPQVQLKPASYYRDEADQVIRLRVASAALLAVSVALVVSGILLNPSDGDSTKVALVPSLGGAALVGVFP
jgi:TolB-like protein